MIIDISYGGGTQSAAICVLIAQGQLSRPERIVMADTGREASQTWDYLRDVINPYTEWKRRVISRYLRQQGYGPQNPVTVWIGISLDEIGRAKPSDVKWLDLDVSVSQ